jgi:prepilin-type N-terminal cleavage/methylation domain-containing protein
MKKALFKKSASASGFSLVEIFVVLAVMAIMAVIAVPYFYNYNKLYKSEDQSLKMMDLMREANQLAINRRRTMRLEIDLTENALLIIDENGAANDTRIKTIPLEKTGQIRVDVIPTGVTKPNPPNYTDITFATDTIGHQFNGTAINGHNIWFCRFRSDGSVVNATDVPINANIYVWPPSAAGASTPRNIKEVRVITMFGGSGAVRYWKHNGTTFLPNQ